MTISIPQPLHAGQEMTRLARFHRDVRWTGTIRAGAVGPGSPAMTATGEGRHHTIQNGLWIVGEYQQDQYLPDGSFVLRWQLHWVAGWDPQAGEYRASVADNYGHLELLAGHIEGHLLTFRSIGRPRLRTQLLWHIVDDETMIWRNEVSVDGGSFELVERYVCTTIS
ncbi:DUF1579 family protein [Kribbella sindirgiensis]|uniref:DUF1579 domain-containing protein n=1 Tax=Kribbella sindirgiensis TaxID=1124744 RepID=A0A4R0I6H5_9ACTN|nr:DUF1579 family protein [Kribbella sindirgiensis]TCC21560.1 DUF1579 domain-containing protein [Kribbella sindirgiensis]